MSVQKATHFSHLYILFAEFLQQTNSSASKRMNAIDDEVMCLRILHAIPKRFELNWEMMRDIVSASVIRCRQGNGNCNIKFHFDIPFDFAFSLDRQSFSDFSVRHFLLRFLFHECDICEISNDYVHSSFYAQLNLANFTSDEIEYGTHCIGRGTEPSRIEPVLRIISTFIPSLGTDFMSERNETPIK